MGWVKLFDDQIVDMMGDEGWDAAGTFMDNIIEIYERNFNRTPTWQEVLFTIEFVYQASIERHTENTPPHP